MLNVAMICWRSSYSTAACSEGISSALHIPCLVRRTPHGASAAICVGRLQRALRELLAVEHVRDQADAQCLLGVQAPAGEHQLVRARGADQARQQPAGPHVAVGQADVQERRAEHRSRGGVADVATERQRQPEARSGAVDRRDHRLRQRAQPQHQRGHVLLVGQAVARFVAAVVAGRLGRSRAGPRPRRSRARRLSGSPRGTSARRRSRAAPRAAPRTARRSSRSAAPGG